MATGLPDAINIEMLNPWDYQEKEQEQAKDGGMPEANEADQVRKIDLSLETLL